MKTSDNGRKFIETFEGLFLEAYDDYNDHIVKPGDPVHGALTIGYGHTTAAGLPKVYAGMSISQNMADAILASDLAAVEADVNQHVTAIINQNQFDALVSFDFNTGALDRSNVLRAVNGRLFNQVAADLNMWVHAGGRILAGLVRRRQAEGALFNTPVVIATGGQSAQS